MHRVLAQLDFLVRLLDMSLHLRSAVGIHDSGLEVRMQRRQQPCCASRLGYACEINKRLSSTVAMHYVVTLKDRQLNTTQFLHARGKWTVLTLFSGLSNAVFAADQKSGGPPSTAAVYRVAFQQVLARIPEVFPKVFINVMALPLNINDTIAVVPLHAECKARCPLPAPWILSSKTPDLCHASTNRAECCTLGYHWFACVRPIAFLS
jgi:hypothetical protein